MFHPFTTSATLMPYFQMCQTIPYLLLHPLQRRRLPARVEAVAELRLVHAQLI